MQPKNRASLLKRKSNFLQNPQLIAAQMTLIPSTNIKATSALSAPPEIDPLEVLSHAQLLWSQNDNTQSINLLKGLLQYLKGTKYSDEQVICLIHTNLAVCYYKIGLLEQAEHQFTVSLSMIHEMGLNMGLKNGIKFMANKNVSTLEKFMQKVRYDMLSTRLELQICILYSQLGKHQKALEHAKIACKLACNMIYDLQLIQYQYLMANKYKNKNKNPYAPEKNLEQSYAESQNLQNLINNIVILDKLINSTKDLKLQFISKQKSELLEQQRCHLAKSFKILNQSRSNLEMLFSLNPENVDTLWIYKNKILDEIQMKFVNQEALSISKFWKNNQVIEKIVYLTIALYCYSTETRFIEKDKQNEDPSQVLDSQHWLSRSLEIAYTFIPHEAPILNQILTVHDRFHGIDKQTIPEDKQVGGFFKVLRPLSKPKSTYSSKSAMCSPIMIRIQVPKIAIQIRQTQNDQESVNQNITTKNNSQKSASNPKIYDKSNIYDISRTIQFDNLTKNNKIRGLISTKKYDLSDISHTQNTIKHKTTSKPSKINSSVEKDKRQMRINIKGLRNLEEKSGNQEELEIKSMRRPHSYDRQIDKTEQFRHPIQTQRRRRNSSLKKDRDFSKQLQREGKKRSVTTNSNSTCLKLDGLQMLPNPFRKTSNDEDDAFQFTSISGKLSNIQTTKMGGNIFISNNINLYISKESMQEHHKLTQEKMDKVIVKQSKRQSYINRRRISNSNLTEFRNPQFVL